MFESTVPVNKYGSCNTTPKCRRRSSRESSRSSTDPSVPPPDASALNVVETQQQAGQRRFAGAGVPYHGDRLTRLDAETHVAQHPILVLIGKPYVIELDRRRARRETQRGAAGDVMCVGVSSSLKTRSLAAIADCRMLYFSLKS